VNGNFKRLKRTAPKEAINSSNKIAASIFTKDWPMANPPHVLIIICRQQNWSAMNFHLYHISVNGLIGLRLRVFLFQEF
jgi:hypothetical protein